MGTSLKSIVHSTVMSSTAVNTFNKSKEDFICFVKKAVQDKKSYSYSELYHSLLKIFVDADTNRDVLSARLPSPSSLMLLLPCPELMVMLQPIQTCTRLGKKRMLPDRRCLTPWISSPLE